MPLVRGVDNWKKVADFEHLWNFSHVLGAIDGKHVAIMCPPYGSSVFYKKFCSIVFIAIVDANYKFLEVDIDRYGSASGAQVINHSAIKDAIESGTASLPPVEHLHQNDAPVTYYFNGDNAFTLKIWLMKPYSRKVLMHQKEIFNYGQSRAQRVVENGFESSSNAPGAC